MQTLFALAISLSAARAQVGVFVGGSSTRKMLRFALPALPPDRGLPSVC